VPFLDTPIPDAEFLFATNVFGVMRMTQAFTPLLIDTAAKISSSSDTSLRRTPLPVIVQIGSVAAVTPYVFGSIYNASKGALHSFSNTFRVEIKPFGVRVCTIITGGVQSNIAVMRSDHSSITAPHTARDPTPVLKPELLRPLPESSLYLPIQEYYNRRQRHSQEGAMPAAAYAKVVVDEALKKNPKDEIWTGKSSSLVWFIMTFIGRWMLDRRMEKVFGLRQLALLVKRGWNGNGKTV
jgi:1-acylglycerone phosphate reductase